MNRRWLHLAQVGLLVALLLIGFAQPVGAAVPVSPNLPARDDWGAMTADSVANWYDDAVQSGAAQRTWIWGPRFWWGLEPYQGRDEVVPANCSFPAPAFTCGTTVPNQRWVAYYDKGRLEDAGGSLTWTPDNPWGITSGLLVEELMTGRLQLGDTTFATRQPAQVPVAGDPDTGDTTPTYAVLGQLRDAHPLAADASVVQTVDQRGTVGADAGLARYGVTAVAVGTPTGHAIASVFWTFLHSSGLVGRQPNLQQGRLFPTPFYVTGYPLTEPYWIQPRVGGVAKTVLVQCFERRCLTYTPSNPAGWQIEFGNVGQHYFLWRYDEPPTH